MLFSPLLLPPQQLSSFHTLELSAEQLCVAQRKTRSPGHTAPPPAPECAEALSTSVSSVGILAGSHKQRIVLTTISIFFHLQVSFPDVEKAEWLNKVRVDCPGFVFHEGENRVRLSCQTLPHFSSGLPAGRMLEELVCRGKAGSSVTSPLSPRWWPRSGPFWASIWRSFSPKLWPQLFEDLTPTCRHLPLHEWNWVKRYLYRRGRNGREEMGTGEAGGLRGSLPPLSSILLSTATAHPWSQGSHWSEQKTDPAGLEHQVLLLATSPGSPSWAL